MDRNLLIPALSAGILITGLCFVENFFIKDLWSEPGAEAAELGARFANVPKEIGEWVGEDLAVDDIVKNTAGAVNYVSRLYTDEATGRAVRMWLIVGHSRDIWRHTPTVCYPASGFRQDGSQIRHVFTDLKDESTAEFATAKFMKDDSFGRKMERVFWAWNHPDVGKWEAPESPRFHYGISNALYKLYFTSDVMLGEDTAEENAAADFAELMLPAINEALFPTTNGSTSAEPESKADADAASESAPAA